PCGPPWPHRPRPSLPGAAASSVHRPRHRRRGDWSLWFRPPSHSRRHPAPAGLSPAP
ncbi:hypothetical protein HEAFMP_HEAFMP_01340, partial [Dysosmobacter welbionis]